MNHRHDLIPAILWHEGMLLSPHHFQQADLRYHQLLTHHLAQISPYHWGVSSLKLDFTSLPSGRFRVLAVQGIMPDGLVINYAAATAVDPLEIDITPFKHSIIDKKMYVYLCVPDTVKDYSCSTGGVGRFVSVEGEEIPDQNSLDNVIRIPRLLPKLSLKMSDHPPSGYISFPLVHIGYGEESYTLKPFYTPCFQVSLTTALGEKCAIITRRLREKTAYLCEKWQAQLGTPLIQETSVQLRPLMEVLPRLEPVIQGGVTHPYDLYILLCQVAGTLSSLRLSQIPPLFPAYNHNDIYSTFLPVFEWIDLLIKSIERLYSLLLFDQDQRSFSLSLQPEFMGDFFLIGVKSSGNMPEADLEHWVKDCIVATDNHLEEARTRRITGAARTLVQGQLLFDLMPGRNVLIYQIKNDPLFIKPGHRLIMVNYADTDQKRPIEVFLYIKHQN